MPVFDQFDVETINTFESSSVDRVYFGTFSATKTPTTESDPKLCIGGKLEQLNLSVFQNYYVPYSVRSGYETGSFVGRFSRTVSLFDQEEYLEDSFVPHPVQIMKANGAVSTLFSTASTTPYGGERWGIRPLGAEGFEMAISTNPVDTAISLENVDIDWHDSFPFQTKYKAIQRTLRQDATFAVDERITLDSAGNSITPPSSSNFLTKFTIYAESNTGLGSFPISLVSLVTSNTSSIIWKERELGSCSWNDLAKTFFGTGDGGKRANRNGVNEGAQTTTVIDIGRYQPRFGFQYKPGSNALANSSYVSIPLIRGFKYGVKNVLAETNTAKYSRTHFGHMRDMLEQRQGYATINKKTGASFYTPVTVTFVSGTSAFQRAVWYASSSTATDFNLRDSGIYDQFYRAGQPFFD